MAITNTGAVERTITGVNSSELFLDESSSTVNNTGTVLRTIVAENESEFILDNSTFYLNPTEGGGDSGDSGAGEAEEANNELGNGRLNTDASGFTLSGGWSYDNGALLHSGTSESLLLFNKTDEAQAAQSLSGNNHKLRFEVKAGSVTLKEGFQGGTDMLNSNGVAGNYGVGVHEMEIQPLNWGSPLSVPMYSSTDGMILDNVFVNFEGND